MGNQNDVEIETIETIPREVTQKIIQKILRMILSGTHVSCRDAQALQC